jgi:Zn-dependent protease
LSDEALLAAVQARGENTASQSSLQPLIVTGVLFLAAGGLSWGWRSVIYLAAAIAVHEFGHVIAMRLFGYKNVRLLFVPFLGGLATGEPRELDAAKNALISLAGPALGLASALFAGIAAWASTQPSWLAQFAWVSLFLNAFNLLPLVPLDGGQFMNDALFSRLPLVELLFRLAAIVGLAVLAIYGHMWLLGGVAAFMALSTPIAYRRACLIRDTRRNPAWADRELDVTAVAELRALVKQLFAKLPAAKYEAAMPAHVHGFWLEIRKRFPGPGKTTALLAGYFFLFVIFFPALAIFLVRCAPRPAM